VTGPPDTSPKKSHIRSITRALIGAVSALLLVAAVIVAFVWHRRRPSIWKSSASSNDSEDMQSASGACVSPFIQTRLQMDADIHNPSLSAQALGQSPHSSTFIPTGLSAKELARIRAQRLSTPRAVTPPTRDSHHDDSVPAVPQTPSSPVAAEQSAPTSLPVFRTMQSQVDRLWGEIQQLRAERSDVEAPPSYVSHDVVHHGGRGGSIRS
jgi:hypothetical protein